GSSAANAKRQLQPAVQRQALVAAPTAGKSPGSGTISAPTTCTTPTTVVSDDTPNDAADMQANHDIVSTSVCTTSADPDNVYFTIKIQSLSAPLTPDSFYFTTFTI